MNTYTAFLRNRVNEQVFERTIKTTSYKKACSIALEVAAKKSQEDGFEWLVSRVDAV